MARNPIDPATLNPAFTNIFDRKNTNSIKYEFYADKDLIPLWLADMDFHAPEAIRKALSKLALEDIYGYTQASQQASNAVIAWMQNKHQWEIKAEWIVWLPGLVPGLSMASRAVGKDGDKNFVFTPVYPPFTKVPKLSRRRKLTQDLFIQNNQWTFDKKLLEENLKQAATFLFCNPHNPVGKMFSKEELECIAELCVKYDVVICSDEIHCDLILIENKKHIPIASLNEAIANRSITLGAPSKVFNLAGIGCSYAIIPNQELRDKFKKAGEAIVPYPNIFSYKAIEVAYTKCQSWLDDMTNILIYNLNTLTNFIKKNPKLSMLPPDATYLAWINASELNLKNAASLFESFGVGLSPGHWFSDDKFVRLNFACPPKLLEEALSRMQKALDSLK